MNDFATKGTAVGAGARLVPGGPAPVATSWPKEHRDVSANGGLRVRKGELQRAWADLVGYFPWEVSLTLTFDPTLWPRQDRRLAEEETRWFLDYIARVFRRRIGWAFAAERLHNGAWHAHALVVGVDRRNWRAPIETWKERCGFIEVRTVWDTGGIANYVTKSVKWDGEVMLSDTMAHYRRRADPKSVGTPGGA